MATDSSDLTALLADFTLLADAAQGTVDLMDRLDAQLEDGNVGRARARVYAEGRRDTFREAARMLEELLGFS